LASDVRVGTISPSVEVAVAHLLAPLDGRAPPQFMVLPASLVVRHSVARL
jgi:DNA-binding LacI/PurR family transcriptional regulator